MNDLREELAAEGVVDLDRWLIENEAYAAEQDRKALATQERARAMKDTAICDRCGATLSTYADTCTAALDEACPGFLAIESTRGA